MSSQKQNSSWLTTRRITSLADAIFAFAMTLLVLNLEIPSPSQGQTASAIFNLLVSLWPRFFDYALSFILLAAFWIIHHRQFHFIKRADSVLLWINIFILMFVVFIPFSTSLVTTHGSLWSAEALFELNLLIVGLLFFLNWFYAAKNKRLVDHSIRTQMIDIYERKSLVIPVISLFAIGIAFIAPAWSTVPYLFLPFIFSWIVGSKK